ncbi:hypothetical protein PR003_g33611 [Phytophthora rubi]|uniref:Uncharacterized protein n=1 Tax=Phytophthora rubi TaxID=129364 RepID=A0A6A4AXI0_9STRA|nr:hypothetical protein PR001_g27750 [Phytophthora rubi]KAE9262243.1 hypothetical protein PR003_g33611 [Phytophthora rubi]
MGVSGVAWSGVCVEWLQSSIQGRMPESQSALVIRPRSSEQKSLPSSPAWLDPGRAARGGRRSRNRRRRLRRVARVEHPGSHAGVAIGSGEPTTIVGAEVAAVVSSVALSGSSCQGWPPEWQSAPASASSGSSRASTVARWSRNRLW